MLSPKFAVGAKTLKHKVRNYSNFLSHSLRYEDDQVIFKVLLKFKMVATD